MGVHPTRPNLDRFNIETSDLWFWASPILKTPHIVPPIG